METPAPGLPRYRQRSFKSRPRPTNGVAVRKYAHTFSTAGYWKGKTKEGIRTPSCDESDFYALHGSRGILSFAQDSRKQLSFFALYPERFNGCLEMTSLRDGRRFYITQVTSPRRAPEAIQFLVLRLNIRPGFLDFPTGDVKLDNKDTTKR